MTDLEITRLCGEAMGYDLVRRSGKKTHGWWAMELSKHYQPLYEDAQAMALVKTWPMPTTAAIRDGIMKHTGRWETFDINRAICECVAKMRLVESKNREPSPDFDTMGG